MAALDTTQALALVAVVAVVHLLLVVPPQVLQLLVLVVLVPRLLFLELRQLTLVVEVEALLMFPAHLAQAAQVGQVVVVLELMALAPQTQEQLILAVVAVETQEMWAAQAALA